jgi:hypothetical protein
MATPAAANPVLYASDPAYRAGFDAFNQAHIAQYGIEVPAGTDAALVNQRVSQYYTPPAAAPVAAPVAAPTYAPNPATPQNGDRMTINPSDPNYSYMTNNLRNMFFDPGSGAPVPFMMNRVDQATRDALMNNTPLSPQQFATLQSMTGDQGANAVANPDGTVSFNNYVDNKFDPGIAVMAALSAGVGGLAMAGAGIGAGAAGAAGASGAGAGSLAALEAGALTGSLGYGAALESSLAGLGAAGAGAGSLTDASWGSGNLTTPSSSIPQFGSPTPDLLGQYGNLPSTIADATALAPTQNLGAGALFDGATTGLGGLGLNISNIPTPPAGGGGGGATDANVVESQGNVTGGGVLNSNLTSGQIESALGLPAGALSGLGGAASSTGSALGRLLSGSATSEDWAKMLGTAGSTALGIYGSNQQADALRGIAEQARTDRQPFLNKSLEWLNNPQAYQDGPGKFALDSTLRALSVQGNPIGNPGNLAIAGDIANRGWQNAVTGFGNLGLAGQDTRSQLLSNAATADRGVTTALSSGLGSLTSPDNSLDALMKKLQGNGFSQFGLV